MKNAQGTRIAMVSLGCPRNTVDSELILGRLKNKGYVVSQLPEADVALVNTCAFIQDAKAESVDAILDLVELKKQGKLKKIIVCGCLPQRYGDELQKELPEVDAFMGRVSLNHGHTRFPLTPRHYAYVKICEGCINACSYCVIPKIKGKFASLPQDSVLAQVKALAARGAREINVVGQDITAYGSDAKNGMGLEGLLERMLEQAKAVEWFRLLYLYPSRVSDALLELIASNPRVCKYIDVPLQHISTRILRLMRRRTTRQEIVKLIARIRKRVPGVAIRTSFIVGFPSETKKDFKELLDFIREARFERLGAFVYSREEDTPACGFKGQVPEEAKAARLDELMMLQQEVSSRVNAAFLGKTVRVLIDEPGVTPGALQPQGTHGVMSLGRTQYDAPEVDGSVWVSSRKPLAAGDFVNVKITDTLEYDLLGELTP
ncbi:MAG: MiaB/RimO family radical SAM methylthiotransferase [Candidatus Omnitrophica bacterium]|nr:MiaB/RimO family radical SAM methylthiotransferase [Candidatus Omnitrophota bacterium]